MAPEKTAQKKPFVMGPNEDASALILIVNPPVLNAASLAADILANARALELTVPIDEKAVAAACAAPAEGGPAKAIVAKGKRPVHGVDCHFEWSAKIGERVERGGRLSHYLGRIEKRVVKSGDVIGRVVRETAGTDGADIYGKPLKAKSGRPVSIKLGANVRDNGGTFYAEKDGLVRDDKGKIQVDEVYIIDKNLDFETGNVTFTGTVIVKGGILDLFTVKAGGAIQVGGMIEAATLMAGGDIEVKGGIAGKKKGIIRAHGSVTAKFLVNAEVYADGDVIVETQAITSKVMTLQGFKAPKGTIAGGEITALAGIVADVIGSDSAVPTSITAGINYTLETVVQDSENEIKKFQKRLAAVDKEIADLKTKTLTAVLREKLTELSMAKSETEQQIAAIDANRNETIAFTRRVAVPVVLIRNTLYPGVSIRLGDCKSVTNHTMQGPLKLTADRNDGTVHFLKVEPEKEA